MARQAAPGGQQAEAIGQRTRDHADVVVGQQPAIDGRTHQLAGVAGLAPERLGPGVDELADDPGQRALGRALVTIKCQDRIRADGPEGGGHPDDQEAEIAIAEIDVRPEQVDRAIGGGNGKGQVPIRAAKMDAGAYRQPTSPRGRT